MLYEGSANEQPPINSGERNANSNEELRKKILSFLLAGATRFHSSNNKGLINNAVFESITTATDYTDRILGKSESITLPNEIDYSFSGNTNVALSADLSKRCIYVNLFLDREDPNERKFTTPDLHGFVLDNRGLILSCLYSLVRNWHALGCPEGTVPFASYPQWAKICGGILESAGYSSPCVREEDAFGIATDPETADMKLLFSLAREKYGDQWITKDQILSIATETDEEIFPKIDFHNRSGQTAFGMMLGRFVGRILNNIRLKSDGHERAARRKYSFIVVEKEKNQGKVVTLVTLGNLCNLHNARGRSNADTDKVAKGYQVTTPAKKDAKIQFWEHPESKPYLTPTVSDEEIIQYIKANPKRSNMDAYTHFSKDAAVIGRLNKLAEEGKLHETIRDGADALYEVRA